LVNFWKNKKTINTRNSLSPKRFVIIVTNPLFCLFRFRKNRIKQKDEIPSPSHPRNKIRGGGLPRISKSMATTKDSSNKKKSQGGV
jgi:hypothetical protein